MSLYRGQFAYPAPRGFKEQVFHYSFDKTTNAILGTAIASAQVVNDIVFQLQNDYDFEARGVKVQLGTAASSLYVWLKDSYGNYLSQTYVPVSRLATGSGAGICGSLIVPFEPSILCPAGGTFTAYIYNPTSGNVNPPAFSFFGVKRCPWEHAA